MYITKNMIDLAKAINRGDTSAWFAFLDACIESGFSELIVDVHKSCGTSVYCQQHCDLVINTLQENNKWFNDVYNTRHD